MAKPTIRFRGFDDEWEQRKLGELYQRNTERNENLIGYDKTISVATMSYKDDGNGASESSLSTYKVIRVGDIAFEGHTNKQFRFGRFVVNDIGTGIMSPRFSTLRPLNEMPVNFWKQYIHSESVMRRILVNSTKAGTMMNELVIPEFLNQTIMVPSENEQAVIGQYFTNIDHLITLHQRKCDEVKSLKKYMLQKMFPQNEQKVPEIRFEGFTEAWEQRKLGEVAQCLDSERIPINAEEREKITGKIPYYGAGNIQGYINKFLFDEELVLLLEDGDAFDDYRTKEIAQYICGKTWVNNHAHVLRPLGNAYFLYSILAHKDIRNWVQLAGASRKKLVQKSMLNIELIMPNLEEQQKIGSYFRELDHLITLHQQKCEELKKIKKFMLQKMFV